MSDLAIIVRCKKCGWRKHMALSAADKVRDFPALGLRKVGVTCGMCGREISQTLPMRPGHEWASPPARLSPRGLLNVDVAGVLRDHERN